MKIDFYSKIVLTVIALSLVVIASNGNPLIREARAQISQNDIYACWQGAQLKEDPTGINKYIVILNCNGN